MESHRPDISEIVTIKSNQGQACRYCDFPIGFDSATGDDRLDVSVNHYLTEHRFKLLHVGTETIPDENYQPWHVTVAVLGR